MKANEDGRIGVETDTGGIDFDESLRARKPDLDDFIEVSLSVKRLSDGTSIRSFFRVLRGGLVVSRLAPEGGRIGVSRHGCEGSGRFQERIFMILLRFILRLTLIFEWSIILKTSGILEFLTVIFVIRRI